MAKGLKTQNLGPRGLGAGLGAWRGQGPWGLGAGGCQGLRGLVTHKKPLFDKSYVIQNHFQVNFGPKMTKLDQNLVHFGAYWMLISLVKIILEIFLHKNCHRNPIMAISCLKRSFLGRENQFFSIFKFFFHIFFFSKFFC